MEEEIKTNCESTGCEPQPIGPPYPLWVLHYHITGNENYRGVAVVKAVDCNQAEQIFRSKSAHNGTQCKIRVTEIKEVYDMPCPDLFAEEYVKATPPPLPKPRRIGKHL